MTLYTSPDNIRLQKHLIGSIIAALFCAFFAAVYEAFSFGVYSYFMIFAFVAPLLGCSLPYSIILFRNKNIPGISALRLWNSGIAVWLFHKTEPELSPFKFRDNLEKA